MLGSFTLPLAIVLGQSILTMGSIVPEIRTISTPSSSLVDIANREVGILGPTVTYFSNGTELAVIHPSEDRVLIPLASDTVKIAAFSTAAAITATVCKTPGVPPIACIGFGAVTVIGAFFAAFSPSGRREFDDVIFNTDYEPVLGCGLRCRLHIEAPEGDWRVIGNSTVHGVFHSLHYRRQGSISGFRSIEHGPISNIGVVSRAEGGEGGVVVDYNWRSLNQQAYNSFHSTSSQIQGFGSTITSAFWNANSIEGCVDFNDSDGRLDTGVFTVGWNGRAFQWQDGQMGGTLNQCQNI